MGGSFILVPLTGGLSGYPKARWRASMPRLRALVELAAGASRIGVSAPGIRLVIRSFQSRPGAAGTENVVGGYAKTLTRSYRSLLRRLPVGGRCRGVKNPSSRPVQADDEWEAAGRGYGGRTAIQGLPGPVEGCG